MFYTIYKTTNIINGKFYIGKHKTKCLADGYMGSGKILKHAIAKYGLDNFHKEILYICKDEDHMNLLESILIVPDVEINYNLCDGGKGGWSYLNRTGRNISDNQKDAARKILYEIALPAANHPNRYDDKMKSLEKANRKKQELYPHSPFYGKNHSVEWKEKQSKIMKSKTKGNLNSQYGTCWITNGVENKKIKKEELDSWVELGYNKGRI